METLDFSRSFVTFVTPQRSNNARIQVECRCELLNTADGSTQVLFLVASCKGEDTYAERNLFLDPNYDFCAVLNETQYSIIRTHASSADDRPDMGPVAGRFERVYSQLTLAPARVLKSAQEVVAATLAGEALVARTELREPDGNRLCRLEYPVKTMNVNDIRGIYQVDTGPVVWPDWQADAELAVGLLRLAYVAFNRSDEAEFVLQTPTEIAPGVFTPHYSAIVAGPARNELLALKSESAT